MMVLLNDLQRFMGREGQVSGFAIVVDHPDDKAEIERIRHDIEALGPEHRGHAHRRVRQLDHRNPLHPRHGLDHLGHRHRSSAPSAC